MKYVRAAMIVWAALMGMAQAHDYQVGELTITHPWTRATAPRAANGVAYMAISNNGATDDVLIGVHAPVSNHAQLHANEMTDGVMQMRPVEGGIVIPAGETVFLEPSGLHVMLMGLGDRLVEGERVPLTLEFQSAGSLDVEATIEGPGAVLDLHSDH